MIFDEKQKAHDDTGHTLICLKKSIKLQINETRDKLVDDVQDLEKELTICKGAER